MQKSLNQDISSLDIFKQQECVLTIRNSGGYAFLAYVNDIVKMDGEIMFEVQLRNGFIKMLPFSEIVQIELSPERGLSPEGGY